MIRTVTVLVLMLTIALPASAQTDTAVEAFRDWSVFNPSDPRECYIVSPPVKTTARRGGNTVSVNRGEIRLFVTIRPSEGVNKELSYTGGYPFRSGSTIDVSIAGQTYSMSPGSGESEEWAWPASPERDTELIEAMRRGSSAQITAVSSRGTQTIDDFSLLGFTAALEKAEELC
ncbi:MAG: invasion associated locus B family protein, partial [Pseudomonadota bacterium]